MKANIIFTLLTTFILITIAVGFYMKWNPTAITILFVLSFVGIICNLISYCKKLILPFGRYCKANIHKSYRIIIRRLAVNCSRKINRWKLEETDERQISLLSPIDDFNRHKEYIIRLKNAIDAKNGANPPTKNGDTRSLFYHPVLVGGKDTIFSVLNCHN